MERQGDRAGGHGWPSKPLHPATCCLGTAATGCAPRRTRRRRLLSRTWPGLQGGCIAKTLSTADLRLATPPLQKSMGDFLQARIDRGDIWEAGGRLRCRRRLGMHVYHLCPQLLLLAQVCRLRSLVKLRIGDANHTVTSDHRVLSPRGSSTQHATAGSWQKQRRAKQMRRCNAPSDDMRPSLLVSHHVVMRRVTTCALLARTRAALRSLLTKPTTAYQTTAPLSRTWPPSATASDTRRYSETSMYHVTDVPSVLSGADTYSSWTRTSKRTVRGHHLSGVVCSVGFRLGANGRTL